MSDEMHRLEDGIPPMPKKRGRHVVRQRAGVTAIERWQRDYECVMMRRAEHDWVTISEKLGYCSPGAAHDAFIRFIRHYPRDDAEDMRDLELMRIEEKCRSLEPTIAAGGLTGVKAAEVWNKLSERRSKLMGLDKPERREITVLSKDTVTAAIEKLNAELTTKALQAGVNLNELTAGDSNDNGAGGGAAE